MIAACLTALLLVQSQFVWIVCASKMTPVVQSRGMSNAWHWVKQPAKTHASACRRLHSKNVQRSLNVRSVAQQIILEVAPKSVFLGDSGKQGLSWDHWHHASRRRLAWHLTVLLLYRHAQRVCAHPHTTCAWLTRFPLRAVTMRLAHVSTIPNALNVSKALTKTVQMAGVPGATQSQKLSVTGCVTALK